MENCKVGFEESEFVDVEVKEKEKPGNYKLTDFKCNMVTLGGIKAEKLKNMIMGALKPEKLKSLMGGRGNQLARFQLGVVGVTIIVLVMLACRMKYSTLGETMASRTFKYETPPFVLPHDRDYRNRGYLMVSSNGGLNQMRSGICDMVTIARFLNVTLVVPELDNNSFWNDRSQFEDVFDVDYFIKSLKDEVRIVKELPQMQKRRLETIPLYSMPPISWSNMSYYYDTILTRFKKYVIIHFTKTDARLANNGLSDEVQKMRCRVSYTALRFIPPIEELGRKIFNILRQKGPFVVLHLRYEMDMLAFSGCTEGCNEKEVEELTGMRYAYPWWKEKQIDSDKKRQAGLCPLTPEETALTLKALDINPNIQVYIAAGYIYGGERRMAGLREVYPNLVKKETLLPPSDLDPFKNYSNQMAALDYTVSLASDIFVATYRGNMAKVVEGHRRYLGYKVTISLDRVVLVKLIDQYKNGTLSWEEFSQSVKAAHTNRMGSPTPRLKILGKPKEEDYFYTNPEECLPPLVQSSRSKINFMAGRHPS